VSNPSLQIKIVTVRFLKIASRPAPAGLELKGNGYAFFQDLSILLEEGVAAVFATPISYSRGFACVP
jgi:hypothetical protein